MPRCLDGALVTSLLQVTILPDTGPVIPLVIVSLGLNLEKNEELSEGLTAATFMFRSYDCKMTAHAAVYYLWPLSPQALTGQ